MAVIAEFSHPCCTRLRRQTIHFGTCRYHGMQYEIIVHVRQFFHAVLLQTHEAFQIRRLLTGAFHAMDHVSFFLFSYEENIEYFDLLDKTKISTSKNTSDRPIGWKIFSVTLNDWQSKMRTESIFFP